MAAALTCEHVADGDLIPRFVLGTLSDQEAERLEAHCFACEACWVQLQAATALRASMATTAAGAEGGKAPRRPGRPWVAWLAAAATLTFMVAAGAHWLRRAEPPAAPEGPAAPAVTPEEAAPVERSATAGQLTVMVRREDDGAVVIAWPTVPGATSYRAGLFSEDGRELWTRDTKDLSIVVSASELGALPQKSGLLAQVEARDVMGVNLARSRPESIPVVR